MKRFSPWLVLGSVCVLLLIAVGSYLSSGRAGVTLPAVHKVPVEHADAAPVIVLPGPTSTPTISAIPVRPSSVVAKLTSTLTPIHDLAVTFDQSTPPPTDSANHVFTAFDFLQDYVTNRTWPTIIHGVPWTNSSVNIQQYQQPLGGVSYWDFWSEHENWDSPFYMYQDDTGDWHTYQTVAVRNAAGQDVQAYLLADRKGPGVMDKIWFTEDAVWMLTTDQSKKDVGPIDNMQDFIEWGDLDKLGNFQIEVDDQIAYDGPIKDWFSGSALGLTPGLAQILTWHHREYGSSGSIVPIPFQKHLRVLLYAGAKKPKWFMATGVRFADTAKVKPFTAADLPLAQMTRLAQNVLQPESFIDSLNPRSLAVQADPGTPAAIRFDGAGTDRKSVV
jgi:hypothetical protein